MKIIADLLLEEEIYRTLYEYSDLRMFYSMMQSIFINNDQDTDILQETIIPICDEKEFDSKGNLVVKAYLYSIIKKSLNEERGNRYSSIDIETIN